MPAPQQSYYNFAAGPISPVTTAETVIGTTRGVSSSYPGCVFAIEAQFDLTTAASATGFVIRVRRDSLTGTAIYTGPVVSTGAGIVFPRAVVSLTDQLPGEVASQVYVVTIASAGATGNASITNIFTKVTVAE